MAQETRDPPDAAKLLQLVFGGYVQSQVIYVAVRLGIADALADGPKDADALARATKAHAPTLRRLMRVLTALGLSDEGADGRYSLTPQGRLLREDVRGSLRMPVLFGVGDWYWRAWGEFLHTVQTGEPAFDHVWGMNAFEFWGRNPEAGEVHDRGMATLTALTTAAILEAYDFSRFGSVVDVGGGTGTLLAAILQKHTALRGMLFDLPHVIERAPDVLRAAGVTDRCELAAGSFFEGLPGGHDAYLLKWIIHDGRRALDRDPARMPRGDERARHAPRRRAGPRRPHDAGGARPLPRRSADGDRDAGREGARPRKSRPFDPLAGPCTL
jgi:O-methyltransferase domain/Dimerisation domain